MSKFGLCFVTLCGVLIGCGKTPVRDVGQFAPYVDRFETAAVQHGKPVVVDNIIIRFGATAINERGVCEVKGDETPLILINPAAWAASTEAEREQLIFHELGHCILHRLHNPDVDPSSGIPKSLMNPYKIDAEIYSAYAAHYVGELFADAP